MSVDEWGERMPRAVGLFNAVAVSVGVTVGSGIFRVPATVAGQFFGGELPVRLRAWDGSEAGPATGPVLVLHSRQALRRLLWHPGELGLA